MITKRAFLIWLALFFGSFPVMWLLAWWFDMLQATGWVLVLWFAPWCGFALGSIYLLFWMSIGRRERTSPETLRWHDANLTMRARAVPRYLWSTVSIEVFVEGTCVLRTGGERREVGFVTHCFDYDGNAHEATLSWGKCMLGSFPCKLTIDGNDVSGSPVVVENWWAVATGIIVQALLVALLLVGANLLFRLLANWRG
jgi:hypothetical protein